MSSLNGKVYSHENSAQYYQNQQQAVGLNQFTSPHELSFYAAKNSYNHPMGNASSSNAICDCSECKQLVKPLQLASNSFLNQQQAMCGCLNPNCGFNQIPSREKSQGESFNYNKNNFNQHMTQQQQQQQQQPAYYQTNSKIRKDHVLPANPAMMSASSHRMLPSSYCSCTECNAMSKLRPGHQIVHPTAIYHTQQTLVKPLDPSKPSNAYQHHQHFANSIPDRAYGKNLTSSPSLSATNEQNYIILSDAETSDSNNSNKTKSMATDTSSNKMDVKRKRSELKLKKFKLKNGETNFYLDDSNAHYERNFSLLTEAKRSFLAHTNPGLKINAENMKRILGKHGRHRHSAESLTSEWSTSSSSSSINSGQHQALVVAPICQKSLDESPTSIVCLAVNSSSDDDNDIELGEVVRIDKIKNAATVEFINSTAAITPAPSPKPVAKAVIEEAPLDAVAELDEDAPVTLSKKIMPIVTPRIQEWIERSAEFAHRLSVDNQLDLARLFRLLDKFWPRLLMIYMIENSFDFCVTKDNHHVNPSGESIGQSEPVEHVLIKNLPREKDALELHAIINKGYKFNLDSTEFNQLRELVLLREDEEEQQDNWILNQSFFLDTQKKFKASIEATRDTEFLDRIVEFLANIYSLNSEVVENLFCKNLSNFKNVKELLDKRLEKLQSSEKVQQEHDEIN